MVNLRVQEQLSSLIKPACSFRHQKYESTLKKLLRNVNEIVNLLEDLQTVYHHEKKLKSKQRSIRERCKQPTKNVPIELTSNILSPDINGEYSRNDNLQCGSIKIGTWSRENETSMESWNKSISEDYRIGDIVGQEGQRRKNETLCKMTPSRDISSDTKTRGVLAAAKMSEPVPLLSALSGKQNYPMGDSKVKYKKYLVKPTFQNDFEIPSTGKPFSEPDKIDTISQIEEKLPTQCRTFATTSIISSHPEPLKTRIKKKSQEWKSSDRIEEDSVNFSSDFITMRSYINPPSKLRKMSASRNFERNIATNTDATITEKLGRQSAGTNLKGTCSKVKYVSKPKIPGVKYIGCKDSDMVKYRLQRSKLPIASKQLVIKSKSSEESDTIKNHSMYHKQRNGKLPNEGSMNSTSVNRTNTEQSINTIILPTKRNHKKISLIQTANKSAQTSALFPIRCIHTKAPRKKRNGPVGRSSAGVNAETSTQVLHSSPSISLEDQEGLNISSHQNIADIIKSLTEEMSSNDFFVSVLPGKVERQAIRINIVDRKRGNILGDFFVDEEQFKEARDEGVFDEFLLFVVVNSL